MKKNYIKPSTELTRIGICSMVCGSTEVRTQDLDGIDTNVESSETFDYNNKKGSGDSQTGNRAKGSMWDDFDEEW